MENKFPLVTIITPSYNHVNFIEKTIESVSCQTYPNIEYYIIDDGSTDGSHDKLKELSEKYTQYIFEIYKENKGHIRLTETINKAQGEYISILSSDDWYMPQKISQQINKFKSLDNNYGVVYSGGLRYFQKEKIYKAPRTNKMMKRGFILKDLLLKPFFILPISPLVKKECFTKYTFSNKYKAEGEAIYFKIAMTYKFDYVDEDLVVMRDHENNTGKEIIKMFHDNIIMRNELFAHPEFPKDLKKLKNRVLSRIYYLKGWEQIRILNNLSEGSKKMKYAIRLNKVFLLNPRTYIMVFIILKRFLTNEN